MGFVKNFTLSVYDDQIGGVCHPQPDENRAVI